MFKLNKKASAWSVAFASVTGIAALGSSHMVFAQEDTIEEVVVTGSRIIRGSVEASVPVLNLDISALTNQGFDNFADLAQTLPQFAPAFGESRTQSTFSGVATSGLNRANLRNLGTQRTVTLVNGRRIPGGSATSPAADFNSMPTANIQRIEVMTGGASAVYGADAVAGVVNIITRQDFEGIEVDLSYSEALKHGDNENPNVSVMWGNTFDEGGHALVTLQRTRQDQVSCADREICEDDFFWGAPATPLAGPAARSGVPAGGRYFVGGASYTMRNGSMVDDKGALIPYVTTIDGYNRNAQRDLAIPTERLMAAIDIAFPMNDDVEVFFEANYGEADINSSFEAHPFQSQAGGSTFGGAPGTVALQPTIPVNNPFVPAALRAAVLANSATATEITWWQRFSQFENRGADSHRDSTRLAGGLRGELESLGGVGSNWNWEVSYVWGSTTEDLKTEGLVGTGQLYYGLRVEPDPALPGQYRCMDAAARATGCIPVNPFSYTDAMKKYLQVGSATRGESELENGVAWMSGELMDLPAGPLNVVFGAETRTFSGYRDYDTTINKGLATGNLIGDIDFVEVGTQELFAEALVPLIADREYIKELSAELALRSSDTDGLDKYETWKYGFSYAPVEDVRFRFMNARAVRTPIPSELSGIGQTFGVVQDPCTQARRGLNATRTANCTADGVPANYVPGQIIEQSVEGFTGGNPNLSEEKSDTMTIGLVWTPSFIENLAVTLDRFEIEIEGAITSVARQAAVDFCYDTADRQFCGEVTRRDHPLIPGANYVLRAVNERLQNIAQYNVEGMDLEVNYSFDLGFAGMANLGDFSSNLLWTHYDKAEQVQAGGTVLDLLGIAGGSTVDQGFIDNTAVLNLGWALNNLSANWNARYIDDAEMGFGTTAAGFPDLNSKIYHNVTFGYQVTEGIEVYGGVNNVFDDKPPFMASGSSGTQALDTVPGYYDVLGRLAYVGATVRF